MIKKEPTKKERLKLLDGEECHIIVSDKGQSIYGSLIHLYGLFYEVCKAMYKVTNVDKKTLEKIFKGSTKLNEKEMATLITKSILDLDKK